MGRGNGARGRVAAVLAWVALGLALIAAAFFIGAPLGYRRGVFTLDTALMWIVPGGLLAGLAAIFVGLVRCAIGWGRTARRGVWVNRAALVIAIAAVAYPLSEIQKGAKLPRIHDISTDTADPPVFVDIAPLRAEAPNTDVYAGPVIAQQQRAGYPDISPIILPISPAEAFAKARAVAQQLHWHLVAAIPEAGRIEATDTTLWFRFTDDIVIRIKPEGEGSRIDIRSASRIGETDLGSNAARIRDFRAALR